MAEWRGFVGPAYQAANIMQDNQALINWFVETDEQEGAKTATALLGAPGSIDMANPYALGPARGFHVLPGGQSAVAVFGTQVVTITVKSATTQASSTTPTIQLNRPTFNYTPVTGVTLSTSTGTVGIRDNGAGGICCIVDGTYLYVLNIATKVLSLSRDAAFLGSYGIAEIDGWFIWAKPNSQTFYTSPLYWNGITAIDATYYALKDDAADNIVAMIEENRELWLIGEATTEVWYNAGGQFFPFARLQGTLQQQGCAAALSVARWAGGLVWLGNNERGTGEVLITQGYHTQNIATPALSYAINQYPVVSDAYGYVYQEEGHEFYVLTFPTADITWVFDFKTAMWHQRGSFNQVDGKFHQVRASCAMNFQNMIITGDFQTGYVYWQTRQWYKERSNPLVAVRRANHLWDRGDRNRMRYNKLQVEFTTGAAPQASQIGYYGTTSDALNPQAMLRWSDDGGRTWGNQHLAPISSAGNTKARTIWRRLGIARDRVFEVSVSAPVNRDIVGASLVAEVLGA